ncbi:hypothetical protein DSECCO2_250590 [anaerobic digester metagenome]
MKNRVFHQWLQHQLWNQRIQKRVIHVGFQNERTGKANALNFHVPLHKVQLLPQRNELVSGNAAAQDVRKIGGDGGNFRGLMNLAHPFDGVQRVIEEVRIQLGLHHANLCGVQLPLLAEGIRQILPQTLGHPVEPSGELAHFVGAVIVDLNVQIALLHLPHGAVQCANRLKQLAAEPHGDDYAQSQTQENGKPCHQMQEAGHPLGQGLWLLQDQIELRMRLLNHIVIICASLVGKRLISQQLAPQTGRQRFRGNIGRGVYLIPKGVQNQKAAGGAVLSVKQQFNMRLRHIQHHIAHRYTSISDGAGGLHTGGTFGEGGRSPIDHAAAIFCGG